MTEYGAMERLLLVSADGHVGAKPDAYRPYLDDRYHSALEDVIRDDDDFARVGDPLNSSFFPPDTLADIDGADVIRSGARYVGAWDVRTRLQELDREGVAGEVLHPQHLAAMTPWFSGLNRPATPELRAVGARAYHRWLADFMAEGDGRLFGVADPGPCLDMDETVAELEWAAGHGYVAVGVPGYILDPDLPPLYDAYYEPFWRACAELGLRLSIHVSWGSPQGTFFKILEMMQAQAIEKELSLDDLGQILAQQMRTSSESPLALDIGPRRAMWQLMLSGAFDRYPDLALVLTEVRADWVPATLAHLDERFASEKTPLKKKPSEYYATNVYMTPSSTHLAEADTRHAIGLDRLMFGVDFPHPESTWPNTLDWIRAAFAHVPEDEARMILGENAVRCYGLGRDHLAAVAERIGPRPAEVLGPQQRVDERLVAHFDLRAGFSKPVEKVDTSALDRAITDDVRGLSGVEPAA